MARHILIIDRDQNARLAMAIVLKHAGYKVSSVLCEEEAVELLTALDSDRSRFDLVILDGEMHGVHSRRLADALRRDNSTIPVLIVSNFSDKAFFIDLVSSGHRDIIEKLCVKGEPGSHSECQRQTHIQEVIA